VEQGGGGAATALGGGLVSAVAVVMVLRGSMLGFGTMGKGGGRCRRGAPGYRGGPSGGSIHRQWAMAR
jgi:hypothetical protein